MSCAYYEQQVKELEAEAEEFCTKEKKWFANLRQERRNVLACQDRMLRLQETLRQIVDSAPEGSETLAEYIVRIRDVVAKEALESFGSNEASR